MNSEKYDVVIPIIPEDFIRNNKNYNLIECYLPVKRFIFIGPEELENELGGLTLNSKVEFINENSIIPYKDVVEAFTRRVQREGYSISGNSRLGWYYQQFLKMSYAYLCEDEYYLVWDSDTIPIRQVNMISDDGKPYLDVKIEHNQAYFDTISALFNNINKDIEYSFISEHMLFKVDIVKELISDIMKTNHIGTTYYEKIANAIDINNLKLGFSEFETYGSYVLKYYKDEYELRRWYSMRSAGYMFNADELTEDDLKWLSKDFFALSFEKNNSVIQPLFDMFHNEKYRELLSPLQLYLKVQESGIFNGMKDG